MHPISSDINIIIIEGKQPVREGWRLALESNSGKKRFCVTGCYKQIKDSLNCTIIAAASIVVIGFEQHDPAINKVKDIININPEVKILACINNEDEEDVLKIAASGVTGIIEKKIPPDDFINVLMAIEKGGAVMSPKIAQKFLDYIEKAFRLKMRPGIKISSMEEKILAGIALGNSFSSVAGSLKVSSETVGRSIKNIYNALYNHFKMNSIFYEVNNQ